MKGDGFILKSWLFGKRPKFGCAFVFFPPDQALESKLAACRNFAKDQAARKNFSKDNGAVINGNATKFSHSLHTTYFDKT